MRYSDIQSELRQRGMYRLPTASWGRTGQGSLKNERRSQHMPEHEWSMRALPKSSRDASRKTSSAARDRAA